MTANIAILDHMEYWPKTLHPYLEFLYQDRQKNQNIPLELQALVGMGLLADHSTVEAGQEEPWRGQAEGRPGSREDKLDWSPARNNTFWEVHKSTFRKVAKCTRTQTAAGGGPVHCPGPATPPGGGWTPGLYMDTQTRTHMKTHLQSLTTCKVNNTYHVWVVALMIVLQKDKSHIFIQRIQCDNWIDCKADH